MKHRLPVLLLIVTLYASLSTASAAPTLPASSGASVVVSNSVLVGTSTNLFSANIGALTNALNEAGFQPGVESDPIASPLAATASNLAAQAVSDAASASNTAAAAQSAADAVSNRVESAAILHRGEYVEIGTDGVVDLSGHRFFRVTVTNHVALTITNYAQEACSILFIQDFTGGWTNAWMDGIQFTGGVKPTITTNAGAADVFWLKDDGVKYFMGVNGQNYLPYPPPPVADFAASTTTPNAGQSVTFTNLTSGLFDSCLWTFGDGGSTNSTNSLVAYTYAAPGTNTVTLIATGPGGVSTNTKPDYIVVAEAAGAALAFDGSQNYAENTSFDPELPTTLTVEAWIKGTAAYGVHAPFVSNQHDETSWTSAASFSLGVYNGTLLELYAYDGSDDIALTASVAWDNGDWHHVAATINASGTQTLWFDGVAVQTSNTDTWLGGVAADYIRFGHQNTHGGGWFEGTVDEVRISSVCRYTDTFTPATSHTPDGNTIAYWKFDEGTGTTAADASGNGHDATLVGDPAPTWVEGR